MLVSKYGFGDVLSERVILDPSRVAAQIVTGIGFIGGGLIFVRRDSVRGLYDRGHCLADGRCRHGLRRLGLPCLFSRYFVPTALHFADCFLCVPSPIMEQAPQVQVDFIAAAGGL